MLLKILALSGWKGSGKDFIADHLLKEDGYTKVSFVGDLRKELSYIYSIPEEWFSAPLFKDSSMFNFPVINSKDFSNTALNYLKEELADGFWTPRALLIHETTTRRAINPDWYSVALMNEIDALEAAGHKKFIITDLRFKNEAEALKDAYGDAVELIRINRFDSTTSTAVSERDLDDYTKFDNVLNLKGMDKEHVKALIDMIYTGRY